MAKKPVKKLYEVQETMVLEMPTLTQSEIVQVKQALTDSKTTVEESGGDFKREELMPMVYGRQGGLVPEIRAIHEGYTKNGHGYKAEKLRGSESLKSGIHSWTLPFPKPVLVNHDMLVDPLGRVEMAQFQTVEDGRGCNVLYPRIVDEDAIVKVLDGRYRTVSIKADTDEARCSICGTDWTKKEPCEHLRNQWYVPGSDEPVEASTPGAEQCKLDLGELWFKEVSFLNNPSDMDAGVTKVNCAEGSGESLSQVSGAVSYSEGEGETMLKSAVVDFQEEIIVSEQVLTKLDKYFESMEAIEDLYQVVLEMAEEE